MNTLKEQAWTALTLARRARLEGRAVSPPAAGGLSRRAAHWLNYAGELRRSAFYLYR